MVVALKETIRLMKIDKGSLGIAGVVAPAVALLAGGSATAARTTTPIPNEPIDKSIVKQPME